MRTQSWEMLAMPQLPANNGDQRVTIRLADQSSASALHTDALIVTTYTDRAKSGYASDEDLWYAMSDEQYGPQLLLVGANDLTAARLFLARVQQGLWMPDVEFIDFTSSNNEVVAYRRQLWSAALKIVERDMAGKQHEVQSISRSGSTAT